MQTHAASGKHASETAARARKTRVERPARVFQRASPARRMSLPVCAQMDRPLVLALSLLLPLLVLAAPACAAWLTGGAAEVVCAG